MYRHRSRPRKDWRRKVEEVGLVFVDTPLPDGTSVAYWNENAYYEFSMAEVLDLERQTAELHALCLQAVEWVLADAARLARFGLPASAHRLIRESYEAGWPTVYGRFDLAYDGSGPAKLLEYNADTPTGLVESAVAQWYWLEDVFPDADQWNSLHERLVQRWRDVRPALLDGPVHFAVAHEESSGEEWMTVGYLQDTAAQAGLDTAVVAIADIGYDERARRFVDAADRPIANLFKLYPWEDVFADPWAARVAEQRRATRWIEPPWKALLSNKALLPVLWELFGGHENLLPAYDDGPRDLASWVGKPLHGREGTGVVLDRLPGAGEAAAAAGRYVYQERVELPSFDGSLPVLGCWIVGGHAAGLGIRESDGPVTDAYARFVPHVISEGRPDVALQRQWLREDQRKDQRKDQHVQQPVNPRDQGRRP